MRGKRKEKEKKGKIWVGRGGIGEDFLTINPSTGHPVIIVMGSTAYDYISAILDSMT